MYTHIVIMFLPINWCRLAAEDFHTPLLGYVVHKHIHVLLSFVLVMLVQDSGLVCPVVVI